MPRFQFVIKEAGGGSVSRATLTITADANLDDAFMRTAAGLFTDPDNLPADYSAGEWATPLTVESITELDVTREVSLTP